MRMSDHVFDFNGNEATLEDGGVLLSELEKIRVDAQKDQRESGGYPP